MIRLAALLALLAASSVQARAVRLPQRPSPAGLLAGQPITPGGLLIREGERLRTLELDELAALRLRFTVRL